MKEIFGVIARLVDSLVRNEEADVLDLLSATKNTDGVCRPHFCYAHCKKYCFVSK